MEEIPHHKNHQDMPPIWIFLWISVLLTFLVYLPVFNNDFVNWDDPVYIQENPHIYYLSLSDFKWMWTSFYTGNWIPISWISLALDYRLGGLNPQVFHLVNLLLHCFNTALVFLLSVRILSFLKNYKDQKNLWFLKPGMIEVSAFLSALFWGIHPIHVESVAWASERKDLLCGFFYLASLLFYVDYLWQPFQKKKKLYVSLGLFVFALLSKSMAVSLPLVLLLLDHWPARRLKGNLFKVLLEKIPFLFAALLVGMVTILFQSKVGTLSNLNQLSLSFRFMNSVHSVVFYLEKMIWPSGLMTFYSIHLKQTFSFGYIFSFLLVILISYVVFIFRKKRPFLTTTWLYFLITLAPVIGIIQVGSQAAADRYTYLPSLGPIILFVSVLVYLLYKWKYGLLLISLILTIPLGYKTVNQVGIWKDSISLWENVLKISPTNSAYVYNNLASAYEDAGRFDDALKWYDFAIKEGPFIGAPHTGKGRIFFDTGLLDESIKEFNNSIALDPNYEVSHNYLGLVYEKMKKYPEALLEIQTALKIKPDYADAYDSLGLIYWDLVDFNKSEKAFRKAIYLSPLNSKYSRDLLETFRKKGSLGL